MLPLNNPTTTFRPVSRRAATTEFSAAMFFSLLPVAGFMCVVRQSVAELPCPAFSQS
jgi:hypothetical protein